MERISFQNTPDGLYNGLYQMGEFTKKIELDQGLHLLMDYYISLLNSCAFCLDMHFKEAEEYGESKVRLSMVKAWRDTDKFSPKEKSLLAYAEAVTLVSDHEVNDELFDDVNAYFSKDEIAYWTLAIVRINGWNRFMKAFKTSAGDYRVGQFA